MKHFINGFKKGFKNGLHYLWKLIEACSFFASAYCFACFVFYFHQKNYPLVFSYAFYCIVFTLWDIQKEIRDKN